jgi:hypothetical protein
MSMNSSRTLMACAWCGLYSEPGPVCNVCGSPVLDVTGWTTVLDVSRPVEPAVASPTTSEVLNRWIALEKVAKLFDVPEPELRSWVEDVPGNAPWPLLVIEPGVQPAAGGIVVPSEPVVVRPPATQAVTPPSLPEPPAASLVDVPPIAHPQPTAPSLWLAPTPAPAPIRLDAAWAFQPTDTERHIIRMEMLRTRGAIMLAAGVGGTVFVYLLDRLLT